MKREVIKTMPESKIVETLIEVTMKTAEELDGVPSGEPEVAGSWHPYTDKRAASDVTFIGRQRGYPMVFATFGDVGPAARVIRLAEQPECRRASRAVGVSRPSGTRSEHPSKPTLPAPLPPA